MNPQRRRQLMGLGVSTLGLGLMGAPALWPRAAWAGASGPPVVPPAAFDPPTPAALSTLVVAGGCFWGVQAVFQHVRGVVSAVAGYAGGRAVTARYGLVGTGATGHAEVVQVSFTPAEVSLGQLLQIWFAVAHDPTQINRQGPDVGPQYRSAVFPRDARQAEVARAYIAQLDRANTFGRRLATTVEPGHAFHRAEDEHQDYLLRHPHDPYIVAHDQPKLVRLQQQFAQRYRFEPVRVTAAG